MSVFVICHLVALAFWAPTNIFLQYVLPCHSIDIFLHDRGLFRQVSYVALQVGGLSLLSTGCWARGVATVLVLWLLCLESSSCWSECLFVALISCGGLWIYLLLLFVEGHLRSECIGGICMVWEPISSLIKALKLWDKLRVWWS